MLTVKFNPTVFDKEPWKSLFPRHKRARATFVMDSSSAVATQAQNFPHNPPHVNNSQFVTADTGVRKHVVGINGIRVDENTLKAQFDGGADSAHAGGGGSFLNQLASAVSNGILEVRNNAGVVLTAADLYNKNF